MEAEKRFKLRYDMSIELPGVTLYRIEALQDLDIHGVKKGDLGGYIEKESNLDGDAWVFDYAKVFGDAVVYDNAVVSDNATVSGYALVFGHAKVTGSSTVSDRARVFGYSMVYGSSRVNGNARVYGQSRLYDIAQVSGNSQLFGDASVYDNACVGGDAHVCGNSRVFGSATVCDRSLVFGEAEVSDKGYVLGRSVVGGDEIKSLSDLRNIAGGDYNITILPRLIQIGCQRHTKEEWWRFTDKEILDMDGRDGLKWWKKWKPILMAICAEAEKGE